jgi:acyl-CoA reductase-like NAD-dependent aldehyde dehydrogenase
MQDCDLAQAAELVRALGDHLREMNRHLAWIESRDVTGTNARASAMRLEAAALRRDIAEALMHIDRLQRRYLSHATENRADLRPRTPAGRPHGRTELAFRR